jgi:long-chain acyl-CoA synthetase
MRKELSYQKYDPAWGAEPIPPVPDESLVDMFRRTVSSFPDKPAVIFLDRETTYRELDGLSDQVALWLVERGIKKGDRVATMLPNCTQHLAVFYGILKAGAIVVPFNVMLKGEEAGYILEDSGAKTLIVLDLLYPVVKPELERLGISDVITVHVKDFSEPTAGIPALLCGEKSVPEGAIDFMEVVAANRGILSEVEFDPKEDLAFLIYTSGTTGFPKGAMISHHNPYGTVVHLQAAIGGRSDDVFYMLFPMFHIGSYAVAVMPAIYIGATLLPVPMFEPAETLRILEKYKATQFCAPPTVYVALLNHPDFSKYDLSSLRFTSASAAPVPTALQEEWRKRVGKYLYNGYGCTETCGNGPGIVELENRRAAVEGSIGSTLGEVKIVDPEGNTVPRGTVGEFMHRGPGIAKGYWNKPEKTREVFTEDGWWRSGDAGYMDDEGFFYFVERIKDLIIASGYNIAPVEVENHLFRHPDILDVAVIGVPDEYRGETVKAYVVLKPGSEGKVSEEDIIQFCRDQMAVYKAPKMVEFIEELPKNQTGKVLRRLLREMHAQSTKG